MSKEALHTRPLALKAITKQGIRSRSHRFRSPRGLEMSANNKGGQALKTAAAIVGAVAASGAAGIALAYAVEQWCVS